MKHKLLILFFFIIGANVSYSAKYDATITTGMFGGIPFWNSDNFSEDYSIESSPNFYRWYNKVGFNCSMNDFSLHISALRNDGFDIRSDIPESDKYQVYLFDSKYHFSETKIHRAYAQYKFTAGNIRAGRMSSFSRWFIGSFDGAELSYNITDNLKVSGFGGKGVRHGLLYDSDYDRPLAYADLSYSTAKFGGKLKYMYNDTSSITGFDLYGSVHGVRFSANFGYDITNKNIYDGALGLYGFIGKKFSASANVSRFRILTPFANFQPALDGDLTPNFGNSNLYIDRAILGLSYKLFDSYTIVFKQMLSSRLDQMDYLSYIYLNHKYFYAGLNFIGGGSGNERLGISAGGNYNISEDMRIGAGVASVDYMLSDYVNESVSSVSSYLKFDWNIMDNLVLNSNLNYYHNRDLFNQKMRGGFTLQYKFKSGE